MKKSKIIIPALAMLVLSSAAAVTGTVAWFTMNTTANTEGMIVAAKTSGSLIIKEAAAMNAAYPTTNDRGTKVIFNSTGHQFYPSTLDWANTQLHSHSNTSGLKKLINGQDINYETGTKKNSGVTLDYDWVNNSTDANTGESNSDYYFDYGVFLAGDGLALNAQDIKVTISAKIGNGAQSETFSDYALDDINAAISVAFYGEYVDAASASRAAVSSANFMGSLNLKPNGNNEANHFTYQGAGQTPAGVDIPVSGSGATYAITMRVYYDGALIKSLKTNEGVDNDFAEYTQITSSGAPESGILYYADNQGTIVNPGTDVNGLWKVDVSKSTVLYARSIEVASIHNMQLNLQFETTNHPTNG